MFVSGNENGSGNEVLRMGEDWGWESHKIIPHPLQLEFYFCQYFKLYSLNVLLSVFYTDKRGNVNL